MKHPVIVVESIVPNVVPESVAEHVYFFYTQNKDRTKLDSPYITFEIGKLCGEASRYPNKTYYVPEHLGKVAGFTVEEMATYFKNTAIKQFKNIVLPDKFKE